MVNEGASAKGAVVPDAIEDIERAVSKLTGLVKQIEGYLCINDYREPPILIDEKINLQKQMPSLSEQRQNVLRSICNEIERNNETLTRCLAEIRDL